MIPHFFHQIICSVSGNEDDEDDEGEGGGAASGGPRKSHIYNMDADDKLLNDDEVVQYQYPDLL